MATSTKELMDVDDTRLLGQPMWSPKDPSSTRMDTFRRKISQEHGVALENYDALWKWSVAHPSLFWEAIWREMGVIASKRWDGGPGASLDKDAKIYPPPLWFKGARLNFAENLMRHCKTQPDRVAVIQSTEVDTKTGKLDERQLTYRQLWQSVANATRAMRRRGVKVGDTVASYSANNTENLIAFLACSAVGAVWSSAAADFAPSGVLERLRTVQPKLIFSVNAVRYNGKVHDHISKLRMVVNQLAQEQSICSHTGQRLEGVIVIDNVGEHGASLDENWTTWDSFLSQGQSATDEDPAHILFEQLDFNHPLWILFSSGTTGQPKSITHRAGGMLLQLSKEHLIHGDMKPSDVTFYFTTTGWMMWNYLIASLVSGATIILFDGSPLKPPCVLWDIAERHGITVFGTSAAYLAALEKTGYMPIEKHKLKVTQVLSTGSPLRPSLYPYVLKAIGKDVLVGSVSGGTDICSLFAGHNTALPVYAGEIQCRNLGMDVDIFDINGKSVGINKEGDLVCKTPFPAQPLGFWRQSEKKYEDSYYSQNPGVWHHGDFAMLSQHGGLVMLGRSDGVLNPGGIRFGSSDIYELLEAQEGRTGAMLAIDDSLVVALKTPTGDDEVVILFLVLSGKVTEEQWNELVAEVKLLVKNKRSARHVPRFVKRVAGVPKTLNGKRVEVPVKKLINGAPLSSINQATLQNPEVLDEYIRLGEELRDELKRVA
ncbi:putative acetoacetyl-CoA synthetase [Tilletiaria anomala UBC 951]|uniref:Putative acetoacetyl-CoA synthetase n=1 Tax=Tilletiaria anomala (strain ATCC 24038 / CBS 436.72 / UBC 951) TaxID=1037660 RepID=A0A066V4W1_TILAU|nr:putative acetoacetyl-CoA synthetase [Tilletiaria anomala UBC 951]KDN35263.1 putative acetoacetyl-CoA synthetase [Tilletiaria anomala UBC 951]